MWHVLVLHSFPLADIFHCMDIPHSTYLFSGDGFPFFFFFAIMNNVTMNICVCTDVCMFTFLLGKYLGVELLAHRVSLCLTF